MQTVLRLEDLKFIGAEPFVRLFETALEICAHHDCAEAKTKSGNTWDAFTVGYREERMEKLDADFFAQPTSISAFLAAHIRDRQRLYVERAQ